MERAIDQVDVVDLAAAKEKREVDVPVGLVAGAEDGDCVGLVAGLEEDSAC